MLSNILWPIAGNNQGWIVDSNRWIRSSCRWLIVGIDRWIGSRRLMWVVGNSSLSIKNKR